MTRIAAYGFLGRYPGDVRRDAYRMPSSISAPMRNFRLYALLCWPDPFSEDELLLSLKIQSKEGTWKERCLSPEPLRHYGTTVPLETVLGAVPSALAAQPGRFLSFVGEGPLSSQALVNTVATASTLADSPSGAVAVRWGGALRGLLLLGRIPV